MTTFRARSLRDIPPLISLDRQSATPLQRQIYEGLRAKIVEGSLRAGQGVPSTRRLADELAVSRIPVLNAYAQLLAEGYLEASVGSGTFVSSSLPNRVAVARQKSTAHVSGPRHVSERASILPGYTRPGWVYGQGPFNISEPALDVFPVRIWSEFLHDYRRTLTASCFQYGNAMGLEELREAIATYLRTARGVRCESSQVMIVSGSQQALDITTRVLLDPGSPVWIEEPGYWLVQHALKVSGCRPIPVRVDKDGLDVAAGIQLCRRPRAVYVAPSHQFPLGVTMSASRRLQLLDFAQKVNAWIVEDDYDSEYRYGSMPIGSLQGLDSHSRVVYIGTFSKVLFPALRLGYIVIPPDLNERFIAVRHSMDICPAHMLQSVLARFIREGQFARHVRSMRQLYSERRKALIEAIRDEFGSGLEMSGVDAGMHLVVMTQKTVQDHELARRAAQEGLWLWPLSPAYLGKARRSGFILGYGNSSAVQMPGAVRHLKRIINSSM